MSDVKRLTVSPKTAEQMLDVKHTFMAELIKAKILDSVMIFGARRITVESIERLAREGYPPRPKAPTGDPAQIAEEALPDKPAEVAQAMPSPRRRGRARRFPTEAALL